MILADTSVWINHFRKPDDCLRGLARNGQICSHPFVAGELAAGKIHPQNRTILMLRNLPQLQSATQERYFEFLEGNELYGKGLGFIDIHLLIAVHDAGSVRIWTADKRLHSEAALLSLAYQP